MKSKYTYFGLFCALFLSISTVNADIYNKSDSIRPKLVDVLPTTVFSPMGFDDNDKIQVVLDGELPDTCYKLGPATYQISEKEKKVFVRQKAYRYDGSFCASVKSRYSKTVNLGLLKAGQYEVVSLKTKGDVGAKTALPVARATKGDADDYLYAPVTNAHVEKSGYVDRHTLAVTKRYTLILHGTFRDSCMAIKEVKVTVRPNNVVEVLPIMTMKGGAGCTSKLEDFSYPVVLENMPEGRFLFHIRSLNGEAINLVKDL